MNIIEELYREYFSILSFTKSKSAPGEVFSIILGYGQIYYDDEDNGLVEMRKFIRQYGTNFGIHPTIAQLYLCHLQYNNLNIFSSLSSEVSDVRGLHLFSPWVDISAVISFYKKYAIKKFGNFLRFSNRRTARSV